MKVVLAGGGTGGHVIPALAIAQGLRRLYHAEVAFVGTSRGIENRLVPAAGYRLRLIDVGALKQVSLLTRLKTLFALPRAIFAAHSFLAEFRPDVVVGVGGYASGPAMLAAVLSSVPTLAFEPNLVPGFANKIVGVMVSAAAVQFEQTCRYFRRCQVTGVPVRPAFFEVPPLPLTPHICERREQISAGGPVQAPAPVTLLVFGGSQGAHAINQAVIDSLAALHEAVPGLHIIHQTGERDYNDAQAAYLRAGISAEVFPFIDDMPGCFARAHLLLCRSGASTVAEIAASARPAIFVPFPKAADDHQTRNAEALCQAGAAVLLPESQLTSARLVTTVRDLLTDPPCLARMAQAARALAHPHAARDIAALAARLAGVSAET